VSCDLGYSLELQGRDLTWEAGHYAGHLPRSQRGSGRPRGAAFRETIVLADTSDYTRVSWRVRVQGGICQPGFGVEPMYTLLWRTVDLKR
jgi:hypothetical protein